MFIFLFTLFFYNGALFYCYRNNEDLLTNLVFTFIFNAAYFYILPELVEFVKDPVKRGRLLLLARGLCVASFCVAALAMFML